MPDPLGPSALAKALGISRQMVYQYEREGKIKRGAGGFDLDLVRAQLAQNLGEKRGGVPRRGVAPDPAAKAAPDPPKPAAARHVEVELEPQPHGGALKREHAIENPDYNAPPGSKADLEKQYLSERVEQKRRENESASGKLIDAAEAETAWGEAVMVARNKALMVPSEIAPKLAIETDVVVCEEIVRNAIYSMLQELSEYHPPAG